MTQSKSDPSKRSSPSDDPNATATAIAPDHGEPTAAPGTRMGKASGEFGKAPIRHESDAKARLVGLDADEEDDGDIEQVTFTFADTKVLPKFDVGYVDVVRAHPEDDPIAVSGNAFLEVGFKLTNPNTDGRMAVEPDLQPDLPLVKEMLLVQNLGGSLRFAVGLDSDAEFRVRPLSSPTRLVVEVREK
ncbi:hypothetical protein GCM10027569_72990 [Flindersiella endophytica]